MSFSSAYNVFVPVYAGLLITSFEKEQIFKTTGGQDSMAPRNNLFRRFFILGKHIGLFFIQTEGSKSF